MHAKSDSPVLSIGKRSRYRVVVVITAALFYSESSSYKTKRNFFTAFFCEAFAEHVLM